jgi:hypothetical protein
MGIQPGKWGGLVVCGFVPVAALFESGCTMAMPKPSGINLKRSQARLRKSSVGGSESALGWPNTEKI